MSQGKSSRKLEEWIKRYFNLSDRSLHRLVREISNQQITCSHHFFDINFLIALKSFLGVSNIEIATDKDGIMFRWPEKEKIIEIESAINTKSRARITH